MSERSVARSEATKQSHIIKYRMENGVKNLKGARLFPKTFSNNGFGDASRPDFYSCSDSFSFPFSGSAANVFQLLANLCSS